MDPPPVRCTSVAGAPGATAAAAVAATATETQTQNDVDEPRESFIEIYNNDNETENEPQTSFTAEPMTRGTLFETKTQTDIADPRETNTESNRLFADAMVNALLEDKAAARLLTEADDADPEARLDPHAMVEAVEAKLEADAIVEATLEAARTRVKAYVASRVKANDQAYTLAKNDRVLVTDAGHARYGQVIVVVVHV